MNRKSTISLFALFVFALIVSISCGNSNKERMFSTDEAQELYLSDEVRAEEAEAAPIQYAPVDFVSSSAAVVGKADSARRFIRTADLRFKTKDAIKATYAIEDIIAKHEGFVANTELRSTVDYAETVRVSRDSTLESTFYTINNTMVLRVPVRKLDTALKDIAVWADFMEYRKVSAADVRLNLLRNALTRRRAIRQEKRLTDVIDNKGQKLNQIVSSEDRLAEKQEQADEAMISNLELQDRIDYSTISIYMWQEQTCKHVLKANSKNINEYRPGFGTRLSYALQTGWQGFVALVVFLAHFWVLWLLVVITIIAIKLFKRKKRSL